MYPGAASGAAYVTDSRRLAQTLLSEAGWDAARVAKAAEAVERHHELRPQWTHGNEVELLRRADLVEVSQGLVPMGIPRSFRQDLARRVPVDGFVGEVVRGLARLRPRAPADDVADLQADVAAWWRRATGAHRRLQNASTTGRLIRRGLPTRRSRT